MKKTHHAFFPPVSPRLCTRIALCVALALGASSAVQAEDDKDKTSYFAKVSTQIRGDYWRPSDDAAWRHDVFVRRARLAAGWSNEWFGFFSEVAADSTDRAPHNRITGFSSLDDGEGTMRLSQAFGELRGDEWKLRAGKSKLPLTRVYLVSSSEQLFWDRPIYTEHLRGFFRRFVDSNVQVQYYDKAQRFAGYLALSDGWNSGDEIYSGFKVRSSSPMVGARLEFSPLWGLEKKKTDGNATVKATSVSAYVAHQGNIKFGAFNEERRVAGVDFLVRPGRLGSISGELNRWTVDGGPDRSEGRGWYLQGALGGLPVEPVARVEHLSLESGLSGRSELKSVSLGVNYYIKGHDLKVGASVQRNTGSSFANTMFPKTLFVVGLQASLSVLGSK